MFPITATMSTRPELILRGDTRCAQLYRAILTESTLPGRTETSKDGTTLDPARGETAGLGKGDRLSTIEPPQNEQTFAVAE